MRGLAWFGLMLVLLLLWLLVLIVAGQASP